MVSNAGTGEEVEMKRAAKHPSGFAAVGASATESLIAVSPRSPPASSEEHAFEQPGSKASVVTFR
jgi:hypothetical protein